MKEAKCECQSACKGNLAVILTLAALLCAVGAGLICLWRHCSTKSYYESWRGYDNCGVH